MCLEIQKDANWPLWKKSAVVQRCICIFSLQIDNFHIKFLSFIDFKRWHFTDLLKALLKMHGLSWKGNSFAKNGVEGVCYLALTHFYLHMHKHTLWITIPLWMWFLVLPCPDISALLLCLGDNPQTRSGVPWLSLIHPRAFPAHLPVLTCFPEQFMELIIYSNVFSFISKLDNFGGCQW